MVLRGILDRSLSSQLCIRGFAPIKELARISKADYKYQRNPNYLQEKEISTFLDKEEYLFFPEVILSYQIKHDTTQKGADKTLTPIQKIETEHKFVSNVDKTQFKIRTQKHNDNPDIRNNSELKIVDFILDDEFLTIQIENNKHPLHRVDGNHRLKAAESATSEKVNNMVVPFCIILSNCIIREQINPDGSVTKIEVSDSEKFEKAVFHNINTKTIPLTSEENLRVILDDDKNFSDDELKNRFGWEYFATRKIFNNIPRNTELVYPYLGKEFNNSPRTFSKQIINLLKNHKKITQKNFSVEKIQQALQYVNQLFGNHTELQGKACIGIVVCAIYLQIANENLNLFINWLIENKMTTLDKIEPNSLIEIYEKIKESKSKQIFISMQFDKESKPRYEAIKEAVKEVNNRHNLEIKLREIRIDEFNQGHSYKIDDQILKLIDDSGLLIADLTSKNINVYHELGFLMGLNQGKKKSQENFILLEDNNLDNSNVGFNIRAFQQLRFNDTLDLKNKLINSLEEYYNLK